METLSRCRAAAVVVVAVVALGGAVAGCSDGADTRVTRVKINDFVRQVSEDAAHLSAQCPQAAADARAFADRWRGEAPVAPEMFDQAVNDQAAATTALCDARASGADESAAARQLADAREEYHDWLVEAKNYQLT